MNMRLCGGLGMMALAIVVAACGSSSSSATPTIAPTPTQGPLTAPFVPSATAPPLTAPSKGGGGGGVTGIPAIANANWTKAVAHIEITGGRSITIDGLGSAFSLDGITSLSFTDAGHTYNVGMTISADESAGVAITATNLITGGTFGTDCQIKITKNEPGELAGEFSCTNVEGADGTTTQTFRVDIRGTFSAKP